MDNARVLLPVVERFGDPTDHVDVPSDVILEELVLLHARRQCRFALLHSLDRRFPTRTVKRNERTHQQLLVARPPIRDLPQALAYEILRRLAVLRREDRRVSMDDGGELRKDVRVRLGRVGVVADRELDDGEAEGPNVRGGGVRGWRALGFALDSFGLVGRDGPREVGGRDEGEIKSSAE